MIMPLLVLILITSNSVLKDLDTNDAPFVAYIAFVCSFASGESLGTF